MEQIVEILGLLVVALNVFLIYRSTKLYDGKLTPLVKRYLFASFAVLPFMGVVLANHHVFERSKTVDSCMDCHVMRPFGNDMKSDSSSTIAARHYKHNWIQKDQCYSCHKDYGLNGTFKAKMDGYRHLAKYVTGTYEEPIVYKGEFNFANCLSCHENTEAFTNVKLHIPLLERFKSNDVGCLNCHGASHPTRSERTPGHANYLELIKELP